MSSYGILHTVRWLHSDSHRVAKLTTLTFDSKVTNPLVALVVFGPIHTLEAPYN